VQGSGIGVAVITRTWGFSPFFSGLVVVKPQSGAVRLSPEAKVMKINFIMDNA
jgi:hypothetical protein